MPQVVVYLILGLPIAAAYAMYATGIVVIHQASRVLNLAHGAMATVPAFLVYSMVVSWGLPTPIAFVGGILAGAFLGLCIERVFVRRLRSVSPTAQTVGTVAAFGLLISLAARIWGTEGHNAPSIFPEGHISVGASQLQYGQIGLIGVAIVATGVLTYLLRRTWLGLAMRGAASNRRAASLMGIDPDRTAAAAWAIGGAQAALAGILLAAVTSLHPYSLSLSVLPAFVAALIGGLASVPGALTGSAIVGLLVGFVPLLGRQPGLRLVLGQVGGVQLTLAIAAMVVMALRGARHTATDVRAAGATPPASRPTGRPARRYPPAAVFFGIVALAGWVWIPGVPFSVLGDASQALLYTIIAVSLVLLTGWVGQISLAQAAFVGVGAYGTALVARHLGLPFPLTIPVGAASAALAALLLGAVALRVRGLYLAVATLIFAWMADSYLFAAPWFSGAGGSVTVRSSPIGFKGGFPYVDITERRILYVSALAAAGLAILACTNLRRSKTGRAFFAVRGSEAAAASLGIDVTRYKLLAFGLSGAMAGVAGTLIVSHQQTIVPAQFAFIFSLFFLSIAVVGGVQSFGGAVAAAVLFAGLGELFFRVEALRGWLDVVSAGLLALVLLFYPGGLAALAPVLSPALIKLRARAARRLEIWAPGLFGADGLGRWARRIAGELRGLTGEVTEARAEVRRAARGVVTATDRRAPAIARWLRGLRTEVREIRLEIRDAVRGVAAWLGGRPGRPRPVQGGAGSGAGVRDALSRLGPDGRSKRITPAAPEERHERRPMLEARTITVRFGGLRALEAASIEVREGEIVGLIGPNGAGKTTMFNAIAGLVPPSAGRVYLRDEDITDLAVHDRAARGIGRTFQAIQLSPELSVSENLLIATHVRNPSGVASHLAMTIGSAVAEREAGRRVGIVGKLLDLDGLGDRLAGDLPFGTLRMVELGRALVTGAPFVMLDEPVAGLDASETDRFAALLRSLRAELGLTVLLIEHDVRLVMRVCDFVYVLDQGRLIASGTPSEVQRDPAVVKAYLGKAHAAPADGAHPPGQR